MGWAGAPRARGRVEPLPSLSLSSGRLPTSWRPGREDGSLLPLLCPRGACSLCPCVLSSYKDASHCVKVHRDPLWPPLNSMTSTKTCFQTRPHSGIWADMVLGHAGLPTTVTELKGVHLSTWAPWRPRERDGLLCLPHSGGCSRGGPSSSRPLARVQSLWILRRHRGRLGTSSREDCWGDQELSPRSRVCPHGRKAVGEAGQPRLGPQSHRARTQ